MVWERCFNKLIPYVAQLSVIFHIVFVEEIKSIYEWNLTYMHNASLQKGKYLCSYSSFEKIHWIRICDQEMNYV